jgi:hypothetical protein
MKNRNEDNVESTNVQVFYREYLKNSRFNAPLLITI